MLLQLAQYDLSEGHELVAEPDRVEPSAGLLRAIAGRGGGQGGKTFVIIFGDPEQSRYEVTLTLTAITGAWLRILHSA